MVVTNFPWLTVLVALPAAGAALLGFVPALRRSAGRLIALAVALVELAIGIYAAATRFDWAAPASYQLYESRTWIPQIGRHLVGLARDRPRPRHDPPGPRARADRARRRLG